MYLEVALKHPYSGSIQNSGDSENFIYELSKSMSSARHDWTSRGTSIQVADAELPRIKKSLI